MNTDQITINECPSKTWSWLKMNKNRVQIASNFLEKQFELENISQNVKISSQNQDFLITEPNQTKKDLDFSSILKSVVKNQKIIEISENVENPIFINLFYSENESSVCSQKIILNENANAKIIFVYNSDLKNQGQSLISTEILCKKGSSAKIIKIQHLGTDFLQIDDTTFLCEENASASLIQIELGGNKIFSSVHANLLGYKSTFNSETAYLCQKNQEYDFNHVCYQFGKKTDCKMYVNGTLKDNAKKTYRGTIDFKNGCSGSTGDEQEQVLLLNPEVVNNSIPIILCDEEDVCGEHGASIGRLSDEILFYMESRGIEKNQAENIMARAKLHAVASKIQDEKTEQLVEEFLNQIFGDN